MSADDRPRDDQVLRTLSPEEAALVAAYPLPAGVPDAVVNKYQLAHALDVSQTTLDKWRQDGLPFEEAGTNGRAYVFRLSVCYGWSSKRRADDASSRLASEGAAQQLRLALVGGDASAGAPKAHLSPREQRDLLELERAYMIAARDRGELMRADDVAETAQGVFVAIRDGLDALPDRLGRELGLDGAGIEAAQRIADDVLAGAIREIKGLIGDA